MAKKSAYTVQQVIDALYKGGGYVSKAASILGCVPQTVYNYRDRHPTIAAEWNAIREARHDFVENALHEQIRQGNITAIIFYLKTQAKSRGYVEQPAVTASASVQQVKVIDYGLDEGPVHIYLPDNGRSPSAKT
ncbi:MAG: helix-turn-helix domain-containing protein [Anaerolineae bacterium]|nr:helix-turn-helix domain-containing protein [Anaerolineae bacterium]MCO5195557.1 helix-turn-helix domain-containing protein [Anaerolineae bacterium]